MHLFYSTDISGEKVYLNNEESKHLAKVLRLNEGEIVIVIDGKGNQFECKIVSAHHKNACLQIVKKETTGKEFGVSIAAAPTKNLSRWEWFLEKATEIGIDRIIPINSYHSERRVLKRERQERILLSAMKQSYKSLLPRLDDLTKLEHLLQLTFEGEKYIAHCYDELPKESLKSIHKKGEKALILIGPEGDFSKEEVELAIQSGFKPISLGESRLRTETAALLACHTIHVIND